MNISDDCLNLIRSSEGFSTKPYLCPAGIPTIGYGSTHYPDGTAVALNDAPITEDQANDLLRSTLGQYEDAVNHYVQVDLTQNQFDALVDFAYNAGAQNLRTSTLLRLLNAGDYMGAAGQFDRWVYGGGQVLQGLVRRRRLEKNLFVGVQVATS